MVGLSLGAELIRAERGVDSVDAGADNQAAINVTRSSKGRSGHYLVDGLHNQICEAQRRHRRMALMVRWTPGHKGIKGNERADDEAKRAAQGESSTDSQLPLHCRGLLPYSKSAAIQHYLKRLKREVASSFSKSSRYQRTHEIDPSAPSSRFQKITASLPHHHSSLLIQLHTGHLPLNGHLHKIGKAKSPKCPACPTRNENIHHFILMCPRFERQRRILERKLGQSSRSLSFLFSNPKAFPALFNYVNSTRCLSSIFGDVTLRETEEP